MHSPKLKLNEIISYQISKFEIINKIKRMFSERIDNYRLIKLLPHVVLKNNAALPRNRNVGNKLWHLIESGLNKIIYHILS